MNNRIQFGILSDVSQVPDGEKKVRIALPGPPEFMNVAQQVGGQTLDQLSSRLSADQQTILADFERQRRAKQIPVPTDDQKVRLFLRSGGEPQTLFGEGPYERRQRLRQLMAERDDFMRVLSRSSLVSDLLNTSISGTAAMEEDEDEEDEEFFTHGSADLVACRHLIAYFSLLRAQRRLQEQQKYQEKLLADLKVSRKNLYRSLQKTELYGTQIGSDRPLSGCAFRPDGKVLATGCFAGGMKLWSIPDCSPKMQLKGHRERVGGISWHPLSHITHDSTSMVHLSSGAADGSVYLWNCNQSDPILSLEGHALRVASTAFHPSGRFLGTASFDLSWRLWDIETGEELLLQEGHSREVLSVNFQHDGALAVSGGMDGIGRVWDLRSGRSIMLLEGHVQSITDTSFLPMGYCVATASADNSVRIHDIRQLKNSVAMVPAHTNLVSQVKFHTPYETASGLNDGVQESTRDINSMITDTDDDLRLLAESLDRLLPRQTQFYSDYMVTAGFDGIAKVWGAGDWKLLSTMEGHSNKVMSMDLSQDGKYVATVSYDRTFKIWALGGC